MIDCNTENSTPETVDTLVWYLGPLSLRAINLPSTTFQRIGAWTTPSLTLQCVLKFARRAAVFSDRRASGHVRECHGALHLGNLALVEGKPVPFDCIEFNPQLRFIDVMSDVAFTWVDLLDHGLRRLAWRLLNRHLEATGDYAGLSTLRFYAVYRALVRAKVALIRRSQST